MQKNPIYHRVLTHITCGKLDTLISLNDLLKSGLMSKAELNSFLPEDSVYFLTPEERLTIAFNICLLRDLDSMGATFLGNTSAFVIELAIAVDKLQISQASR